MGKRVTDSTAQYIQRFREIYGDKYKYPDFIRNSSHLIDIECPVHGVFQRTPHRHLKQGCSKCGPRGDPFTKFTNRARELFGDKFTYDKDTFTTSQEKTRIICPDHGEFWQELYSHVRLKHGCPKCGFEVSAQHSRDDLQSFLEKAKAKHGDLYGYADVVYIDSVTEVDIYCWRHKRLFRQQPASHIRGNGCPKCKSSRGERTIISFLDKHSIYYIPQHDLPGARYRYDFYLIDYHIFIEFHGRQHYEFNKYFYDSEEHFRARQKADNDKIAIIKSIDGKLIVANYTHLENGSLEQYLMLQLIQHGVPLEVFRQN